MKTYNLALADTGSVIGVAFCNVGDAFEGLPEAESEQFR